MPFRRVSLETLPTRFVLSAHANAKEGKTHFALTAEPPIWFMNLDHGVRELLHKFPGLDIQIADFDLTETVDPREMDKVLGTFHADYLAALAEGKKVGKGTLVIDTGTQVWQTVQKVKLDNVKSERIRAYKAKHNGREPDDGDIRMFGFDYADANAYMHGMVSRGIQQEAINVIWLHRSTEAYTSDGAPSGLYRYQGFKAMPYIVQMQIRLNSVRVPGADPKKFQMMATIEHSRHDKALEGMQVADPTFDLIAASVR